MAVDTAQRRYSAVGIARGHGVFYLPTSGGVNLSGDRAAVVWLYPENFDEETDGSPRLSARRRRFMAVWIRRNVGR